MSRTQRLREEVVRLLGDAGPRNTVQILDHLNARFRWGATMNQLGNIMAKDGRFRKLGTERGGFRGMRYDVCVWALASHREPVGGPVLAMA